jgi:ABC-type Fe3+-hydroxamate transport system substrate-binding protein
VPLPRQNPPRDELIDAAGTPHVAVTAPPRIVSLVPSVTELVCDLGLAGALVGRTGFCIHPRDAVRRIPKVGGTKDLNLARIRELAPTHVIVNIDENEKPAVDELAGFVPAVIVTHPLAPRDNLALYRLLGGIFCCEDRAAQLGNAFAQAYDYAVNACAGLPRQKVLYLIWREPWMTVARDTYISRTLALVGWDTLPVSARVRYPEIELDAALLADVDRVLLSSEPYRFRERDVASVQKLLPPGAHCTVSLIDGEMTSWYGSRAIAGLRHLAGLRRGPG